MNMHNRKRRITHNENSNQPLDRPPDQKKIFSTEEDAVREIVREYILQQITSLRREVERFENKYGMRFD